MDLLEKHKGMLYKISRLYQDDPEDRQDLLQEIIAQLWTSYKTFRGESAFSTWMYRVALNTAILYLKKNNRHRDRFTHQPYPDLPDQIEQVNSAEEKLKIFHKALTRCNQLEKALVFCYMEGRSGEETAAILGITPVNARVRLSRVKDKLQYIIKTMGYEL